MYYSLQGDIGFRGPPGIPGPPGKAVCIYFSASLWPCLPRPKPKAHSSRAKLFAGSEEEGCAGHLHQIIPFFPPVRAMLFHLTQIS